MWRGHLSLRKVAVLAARLPLDSATATEVRGYQHWSDTDFMLAGINDATRRLVWFQTKDGHKGINPPKPFPRPGVKDPNEQKIGRGSWSLAEMRRMLDRWPGRRRPKE